MRGALTRTALAVALTAVTVLAAAGPATAHASQIGSTPRAGAVLHKPPARVTVQFDSPLMDVGTGMVVRSANGITISMDPPRVSRNTVAIRVRDDAPPGKYTVAYRVVSQDGHIVTSTFSYTIAGSASGTPSPAPTLPAPATSGQPTLTVPATTPESAAPDAATGAAPGPYVAGIIVIAVVLIGGLAVILLRANRTRSRRPQ